MSKTDLWNDIEITKEQELLKESLLDWGIRNQNLTAERSIKMNQEGYPFPEDIIEGLGNLGVIMGVVPQEHGGQDLSWKDQALIADVLGYLDPSIATAAGIMAVMTGWGFTIDRYASEEVREKYIKPAMNGEQFLGIATTEPGGGSDVAGFESTAEKDGDRWILNGEKTFISGTEECKKIGGGYWVNVRTQPKSEVEKPHQGMTSFFIPIDADGLETEEPYRDAGRMALSTAGLRMENVEIPDEYRLGPVGKGFYLTMEGFDNARLLIGASACGVTRRVLEEASDYIKEREVFGNPLAKYEGIQFEFADLYTRMKQLRLTYQKTADMQDTRYQEEGMPERTGRAETYTPTEVAKWISMIKLKGPTLAEEAARKTMHWLGAAGYTDEYIFETAWKGVMSYCVGAEGGKNIQKIVISRETLGPEFVPYK